MKRKLRIALSGVALVLLLGPLAAADVRREINFPDILGYRTLKCDLHLHTVFSDAMVWPTVRVDEAWREGLDVISITDHIEYQPHKADIPTHHNRPYEIALPRAREKNILLIKGAEITRETPPGHFNAIFLTEIGPLDTNDLIDVVQAANAQGGFVFWNHPGWKPKAKGWFDIHTKLYESNWLGGIEVANGDSYYPQAHQWALEKNLTMIGNSDMHAPSLAVKSSPENHRTLTLVFAKEKSVEGLREALAGGRTVIWQKEQLIGKRQYLEEIFKGSIRVGEPHHAQKDTIWLEIRNRSDIDIAMERRGDLGPQELTLPANSTTILRTKVDREAAQVRLPYLVKNFLTAPEKGLPVTLMIPLKQPAVPPSAHLRYP